MWTYIVVVNFAYIMAMILWLILLEVDQRKKDAMAWSFH